MTCLIISHVADLNWRKALTLLFHALDRLKYSVELKHKTVIKNFCQFWVISEKAVGSSTKNTVHI